MQPELTISAEPGPDNQPDNQPDSQQDQPEPTSAPPPPQPSVWRERVRRHRRAIMVTVTLSALLLPVAWSYVAAINRPSNQGLGVRTVEWLRDNHLRWLVNDFESFWYNHHKPKKGGAPQGRLAGSIKSGPPGSPAGKTPVAAGPRHLPAPPPIPTIVSQPLPGEGQWHPLGEPVDGIPAMYAAYVRPDPVYTSLVTGVAWIDPNLTRTELYAGVQDPGGRSWRYQAPIADADRAGLLAAFNSGFKLKDQSGGYYAEGRVVKALKDGAATLVIRRDGTPTVGMWGRDVQLGPDVAYARQNLLLIVDNGQPVPTLDTDSNARWGATLGNKVLVWRSAVGVTANGALIYAGGNKLSARSLATVMAHAGAVRAMELDINSAWVAFFTYSAALAGHPPADLTVTKLLPDMRAASSRFFTMEARDFMAVFRRY